MKLLTKAEKKKLDNMKLCWICGTFYEGKRCPYKNKHSKWMENPNMKKWLKSGRAGI